MYSKRGSVENEIICEDIRLCNIRYWGPRTASSTVCPQSVQESHRTTRSQERSFQARGSLIRSIKENDSKADRRFCFEIQMPNRSLLLQAENAETRDIWVSVLNKAVGYYLNQGNQRKSSDGNSNGNIQSPTLSNKVAKPKKPSLSNQIVETEGNQKCADCGCIETGSVTWSSINIGEHP